MLSIFEQRKGLDPLQPNKLQRLNVNTVTFTWPSAIPPVAPVGTNTVRGTVVTDGVTTTQTITHNLGFSAAELAVGLPEVVIEPAAAANHTFDIFISSKTANTVVFTYLAVAFTFNFTIRRPMSAIA